MRIAVMGIGGLGGYFGGLLAHTGEAVSFIARGATLEALRSNGLTVKSKLVGDFTLPVQVTDDPRTIGPVDVVLFAVKAFDLDDAAAALPPLIGPETVVLALQNGIDNEERLARFIGNDPVVGTVVYVSATTEAPGVIRQPAGPGRIRCGELTGGPSPRLERLRDALQRPGLVAEVDPNIRVALWQKFIGICGLSGVTALTRLDLPSILACPETRTFYRGVLTEVDAVARARGIALPATTVDDMLALFASVPEPGLRGSMAYDLDAGRRLELETLNGTVVRLGDELGVPPPFNFAIYAALKPFVDGRPPAPR